MGRQYSKAHEEKAVALLEERRIRQGFYAALDEVATEMKCHPATLAKWWGRREKSE